MLNLGCVRMLKLATYGLIYVLRYLKYNALESLAQTRLH